VGGRGNGEGDIAASNCWGYLVAKGDRPEWEVSEWERLVLGERRGGVWLRRIRGPQGRPAGVRGGTSGL